MKKSIILGTAGHIDHGKTALVKALTGVDTDRLPEEKARGITIDIGFAHMELAGLELSFIDVPGHEKFIKNMLAGIGGIDYLLLIIAADESIMPQTREHFDICRLLQIPAGMIVITKKDLVDDDSLELVKQEAMELVQGSFLEGAPVLAVSAKTGEGLSELRQQLELSLKNIPQRAASGIFRLPIDRVFTLKGHGTIVTGTLISGQLSRDKSVEILPSHRKAKVRSIHAHDENVDSAIAGQRTAVNLMGVEKDEIERGDTLTEIDFFENTSLIDVWLTLLKTSRPLAHNALVRFHHLTNDVLARVSILESAVLKPGESGLAQIRIQRPLFAVYGDRFILRRQSPLITIGGGIILDHMPSRRYRKKDQANVVRLKSLQDGDRVTRLFHAVSGRSGEGADEKFLKAKLALPVEEILKLSSPDVLFLRQRPLLAVTTAFANEILSRARMEVEKFHSQNPLLPGISREELRTRHFPFVNPEVFVALLERAVSGQFLQLQKDTLAVPGRIVALSSEEGELISKLEEAVRKAGLEFPGLEPLAAGLKHSMEPMKKMLYLLVRQGKIVKITDDYFLHRDHWEALKKKISSLKPVQKTFSVPDFKARFGITRKFAIPLLEQLDREGITRRSGNERIIL